MNRVWIELEKPAVGSDVAPTVEDQRRIMEGNAALLSTMLGRLTNPDVLNKGVAVARVFVYEHKRGLDYAIDNGAGFVTLNDNGHWFNLDYLGRKDL